MPSKILSFRIADAYLGRLTNEQNKATNTTAFDLQVDPAQCGYNLRRVTDSIVLYFWSASVSQDNRIVVHQADDARQEL